MSESIIKLDGKYYELAPRSGTEHGSCTGCAFRNDLMNCGDPITEECLGGTNVGNNPVWNEIITTGE
jgi:hypothetical protein